MKTTGKVKNYLLLKTIDKLNQIINKINIPALFYNNLKNVSYPIFKLGYTTSTVH